jgi:NAD(P)-dependent dehydrogenase (short-subunit alcohol dehydrogenase family)
MARLNGKIALITGGAAGIGLAAAKLFVEEGAKVFLVDINAAQLDAAAREIEGDKVGTFTADVSDAAQARAYVQAAVDRFGRIDIYLANAGIEGQVSPIVDHPPEAFDQVLAVNVRGVWLGIKHVTPVMAESGGGSIVITSSIAGVIGVAGLSPYIASKHAVIGIAKSAALELAPMGIRVNTVNPGQVETRMMRSIEEGAAPGNAAAVKEGFEQQIPLGRYATPEEIARLMLFLASDESSYTTGSVHIADGGFTVG